MHTQYCYTKICAVGNYTKKSGRMHFDLSYNRCAWLFLQIKNEGDDIDDGAGQLLLSLMAMMFSRCDRGDPIIGTTIHPLRMSLFCVPSIKKSAVVN